MFVFKIETILIESDLIDYLNSHMDTSSAYEGDCVDKTSINRHEPVIKSIKD